MCLSDLQYKIWKFVLRTLKEGFGQFHVPMDSVLKRTCNSEVQSLNMFKVHFDHVVNGYYKTNFVSG